MGARTEDGLGFRRMGEGLAKAFVHSGHRPIHRDALPFELSKVGLSQREAAGATKIMRLMMDSPRGSNIFPAFQGFAIAKRGRTLYYYQRDFEHLLPKGFVPTVPEAKFHWTEIENRNAGRYNRKIESLKVDLLSLKTVLDSIPLERAALEEILRRGEEIDIELDLLKKEMRRGLP